MLRFLSPLRAVALPGETRGGIVIAAYAAPRGSNRQPVLLPTAARPERWQLASAPLTFPPFAHQGGGVLPRGCGEGQAEVRATPGSPQPGALGRVLGWQQVVPPLLARGDKKRL